MRSIMQPLSYQIHNTSCWVTSMMNGLLVLYRDKNKVPTLAYRLLHTVLTNDGVLSTGPAKYEWPIVIDAVSAATKFNIINYTGKNVGIAITSLHFNNQVAICDTEAGNHSVLITGMCGDWLEGFDPDWDNIKDAASIPGKYEVFPDGIAGVQCKVNFRVSADYFVTSYRGKSTKLRMGEVSSRILTVIERR